ncbi:MAG: phosphatase PAP2-related protein [bacterium]
MTLLTHIHKKNKEIARRYATYSKNPYFLKAFTLSLPLAIAGFIVNLYAIHFATEHASNAVTDLILSNTPVFDVDQLFVYGTFAVAAITALFCFAHPKRIPFALYTLALFYLIRSGFVSLTHIAPFEPHLVTDFGANINKAFFGGDRFFSAHTGMPFLAALAFWDNKMVRYFFLGASFFFGVIVLLGHLHYSIDVLSAFFITYAIYDLAKWLFPKAHALFSSSD